eukprot:TRINITY_DN937_c0_g2_i1.p1 TRINITY_DN937_c0_g2~~TRINITY_DN937_c0_g2_i1.p1  ORF type:complete len:477 (-),score=98.75 TRINITY_DN937_c0_g2_i1:149-1531(-)
MSAFAQPTATIKAGRSNVASHMAVYQPPPRTRARQFEELDDGDIGNEDDDNDDDLDLSRLDPNYQQRQELIRQHNESLAEFADLDETQRSSVHRAQRPTHVPRSATQRVPRLHIQGAGELPPTVQAGRLDTPQRVQVTPAAVGRTPRRVDNAATASEATGLASGNTTGRFGKQLTTEPVKMNNVDNTGENGVPSASTTEGAASTLKDYETLAFACRRAGKPYQEGLAYYNMGILCDNKQLYKKAIAYYQKYARICRRLRHNWGEALACNHIGVNYQYLGGRYITLAIEHHLRHAELASENGKFIAYCNLGLCYSKLGDNEAAQSNYRNALRYAVRVSNKAGESMVIANMAKTDRALGDVTTARSATERQLALAAQLHDSGGQKDAVTKLGELASKEGDYDDAEHYFTEARKLATQTRDRQLANSALMHLGVVQGNKNMSEYMTNVAKQLQAFNMTPAEQR